VVIGPTGVALEHDGTLEPADTLSNRIVTMARAMMRTTAAADGGTTISKEGSSRSRPCRRSRRTATS